LRVGEVAALRFDDVVDANDTVRDEMTLDAARTKSKRARKIFLPKQMQRQLQEYVSSVAKRPQHGYLFSTQKSARFSANTATQHLQRLYARAGIAGATSHSGRRTWLTTHRQLPNHLCLQKPSFSWDLLFKVFHQKRTSLQLQLVSRCRSVLVQ